jgi:hypothetical protein
MRTRAIGWGWGAALVAVVMPAVAGAQVSWLLGGGGSLASKVPDGLSNAGLGYNVLAAASVPLQVLPLALRIDVQYDQQAEPQSVNRMQVYSATANLQYVVFHLALFEPYVIGGGGYYHILNRYLSEPSGPSPYEVQVTSNGFGINAGFGVRAGVGRFALFGEWRYHEVFATQPNSPYSSTSYAPFTIGVSF